MKKYTQYRNQEIAAAKAGMNIKTARKYLNSPLQSELQKPHRKNAKPDPFSEHWPEIEKRLTDAPELEARALLDYLIEKYPDKYSLKYLRTLQRRFQVWRAVHGESKAVMFLQKHYPGKQSQSDFTFMNELEITIQGQPFKHLLFHFMLVYSRWEDVMICHSETFDNLLHGFEKAVWRLGGVALDHRTDNLSAAITPSLDRKKFTEKWQNVMNHYGMKPSTNQPGVANENGSVEKSHDLLKNAVKQHLILRGSRDFRTQEEYEKFLEVIVQKRNNTRQEKIREEAEKLKGLPEDKWYFPAVTSVRVNPSSIVQIKQVGYSVPSRLISYTLTAHVYPDHIELYYGKHCLQTMPRQESGFCIDYRHIIDSLIRKPNAFHDYQYQAALFPRKSFRQAYEQLSDAHNHNDFRDYLKLLQLAKLHGEQQVHNILEKLFSQDEVPSSERVKSSLETSEPRNYHAVEVHSPELIVYDQLRQGVNQ